MHYINRNIYANLANVINICSYLASAGHFNLG